MDVILIVLLVMVLPYLIGNALTLLNIRRQGRAEFRKLSQKPTTPESIQYLDKAIELRKLAETLWKVPPPGNAGVKHAKTRGPAPKKASDKTREIYEVAAQMVSESQAREKAHVSADVDLRRFKKSIASELDRLAKLNTLLDVDPFGLKKAHATEVDRRTKLADAFRTEPGALWLLHDGVVGEAWYEAHLFDECITLMTQVQEDDARSFYERRLLKAIDSTLSNDRVFGMKTLLGDLRFFLESYDTSEITYIESWGGEVQRIAIAPIRPVSAQRTKESIEAERTSVGWSKEVDMVRDVKLSQIRQRVSGICTPPQRTEQEP